MVHALMKLEEAGFIKRERTLRDRRAAMIELTEKGRDLIEVCSPLIVKANVQALAGFTAEESRLLSTLLKRLIANMQGQSESGDNADDAVFR